MEFALKPHGTDGYYLVKVNGQTVFNVSGVFSRVTANDYANNILLMSGGTGHFDDLYVVQRNAGLNNLDFLGDLRVESLLPTAGGTYADITWTASAGTLVQCVDDAAPNSDTDYIAADSGKATFAFSDPVTQFGQVAAVQVSQFMRKDDALTRDLRDFIYWGAMAHYFVGPFFTAASSYTYSRTVHETWDNGLEVPHSGLGYGEGYGVRGGRTGRGIEEGERCRQEYHR